MSRAIGPPLTRFARHPALWRGLGWVACGTVLVVLLVVATGADFTTALTGWFQGAFGSFLAATQTVLDAVPLLLVALGLAPSLRAGVVSVGAEGQMIAGAAAAASLALCSGAGLPASLALPLDAATAMLAGAAWAGLAALAYNALGVSVILFTLLTNYLAADGLAWLLRTALRDPAGAASPQSAALPPGFLLGQLPIPGRLHDAALLLVPILLGFLWWHRSRSAFLIDTSGVRPDLARRCGLSHARAVTTTMLISGAAAGLAGWMQLAGVDQRLQPGVAGGVGFSGIAVAVLGRSHPLGILAASLLFASLTTGADGLEMLTGTTPASVGTVAQGLILIAAALAVGKPANLTA